MTRTSSRCVPGALRPVRASGAATGAVAHDRPAGGRGGGCGDGQGAGESPPFRFAGTSPQLFSSAREMNAGGGPPARPCPIARIHLNPFRTKQEQSNE